MTAGIEAYKFNEAATAIYEFTWGTFCDWYLELAKPILNGEDDAAKAETRATAAWVLDQILKLLHPFMPFITEELWARLVEVGVERASLLCLSSLAGVRGPGRRAGRRGDRLARQARQRGALGALGDERAGRAPRSRWCWSAPTRRRARAPRPTRTPSSAWPALDAISFAKAPPKGSAQIVLGEATAALPLAGVIDMGAERTRLAREIDKAQGEIRKVDAKLANASFVAKAPPEVVEENRERRAAFEATLAKLQAALKRVEAAT